MCVDCQAAVGREQWTQGSGDLLTPEPNISSTQIYARVLCTEASSEQNAHEDSGSVCLWGEELSGWEGGFVIFFQTV